MLGPILRLGLLFSGKHGRKAELLEKPETRAQLWGPYLSSQTTVCPWESFILREPLFPGDVRDLIIVTYRIVVKHNGNKKKERLSYANETTVILNFSKTVA